VTKVYNGTTAATLAAGNYTLTGVDRADVVTLNNPVAGPMTRSMRNWQTVSVAGLAISGANSSDYVLAATTGFGTRRHHHQAALTYVANPASRTYGAANPALSGTTTGLSGQRHPGQATTGTLAFTTTTGGDGKQCRKLSDHRQRASRANNGNYSLNQAAGNATG